MREGSLDAPTRHAIAWDDLDFADRTKTAAEMRRIWDICHTCRRCFNLCDAFLDVAGERIRGQPDPTRENTSAEGKASAVQFLKFPFTRDQITRFKTPGMQVVVGFDHSNYAHMVVLPERGRAALSDDFD